MSQQNVLQSRTEFAINLLMLNQKIIDSHKTSIGKHELNLNLDREEKHYYHRIHLEPLLPPTYLDEGHHGDDAIVTVGHSVPFFAVERVNVSDNFEPRMKIHIPIGHLQIDTHQLLQWPVDFVRIDGTKKVHIDHDDHLRCTVGEVENARRQRVNMSDHDGRQHGRVERHVGANVRQKQ